MPARKATVGASTGSSRAWGERRPRAQSTFMVEMRETAASCAETTSRSLVVFDEIGRGTSTFDGLSIAWAVASTCTTWCGRGRCSRRTTTSSARWRSRAKARGQRQRCRRGRRATTSSSANSRRAARVNYGVAVVSSRACRAVLARARAAQGDGAGRGPFRRAPKQMGLFRRAPERVAARRPPRSTRSRRPTSTA